MHENELNPQQEMPEELPQVLSEDTDSFDLDEIMKEFAAPEDGEPFPGDVPVESAVQDTVVFQTEPEDLLITFTPQKSAAKVKNAVRITDETIRMDLPARQEKMEDMGDTIRLENVEELAEKARLAQQEKQEQPEVREEAPAAEPFSDAWQPEYEQPMGEYVPPQPIIFHPRSRLRELKRKLVAGPERRYYEINEIGFGKLQIAIFLSCLVVLLSVASVVLYEMGMVQENRMRQIGRAHV